MKLRINIRKKKTAFHSKKININIKDNTGRAIEDLSTNAILAAIGVIQNTNKNAQMSTSSL